MGNKQMLKNRIVFFLIGIIIFFLMVNLVIKLYMKSNSELTSKNYIITRMQIDENPPENNDLIPFFDFIFPLKNISPGPIQEIRPEFSGYNLKSIEFRNRDVDKKSMLIEVSELIFDRTSVLKWIFIKEYRQGNYDEYKNNLISVGWDDYKWWNLYGNLKLLLYMNERSKIIPEGLNEINILNFEGYKGYLEKYETDKNNIYFGYNFLIGKNFYNIIFRGYLNKSDVLNFVKNIKRIKNIAHEYEKVFNKYKSNTNYYKKLYLLSAISLMPKKNFLYNEWKQRYEM